MSSAIKTAEHADTEDLSDLRVVPVRHPWRWVASAVVLVLAAMAGHALVTNTAFDWPTFAGYVFY